MPEHKLLAYAVQDEDGIGGIVFAKSNAEARRTGSAQFGSGDFNWGGATRLQWADQFAPGPVPFKEMFDRGWWQECDGCGCMMRDGECDDEGDEREFDIVEIGNAVYCAPACRESFLADKIEKKRIEDWVIGDLTDRLLRLMPGAIGCGESHVYVRGGNRPCAPEQAYIQFTYPGARHGLGYLRFDKIGEAPHVTVAAGDMVAFRRWREAGYPAHLMDAQEVA